MPRKKGRRDGRAIGRDKRGVRKPVTPWVWSFKVGRSISFVVNHRKMGTAAIIVKCMQSGLGRGNEESTSVSRLCSASGFAARVHRADGHSGDGFFHRAEASVGRRGLRSAER